MNSFSSCFYLFCALELNYWRGKTNRLYGTICSNTQFPSYKKGRVVLRSCTSCTRRLWPGLGLVWVGQYLISSSSALSGCVRLVMRLAGPGDVTKVVIFVKAKQLFVF